MPSFIVLDTSQLSDELLGLTPSLIIDTGELNTNGLSYDGYDSDLGYNTNFFTYEGVFNWSATAESTFGSISSQTTSLITKVLSANSDLGSLQANANESIANYAHASTQLLGLIVESSAIITKIATSLSDFGSLLAESTSIIDNFDNATANLGGMVASASYSIPTPPTPEPQLYGSSPYYKKIIKKKVKPQPEPVFKVKIEKIEPLPELHKTHFAKITTQLSETQISAESIIEFSILEDEAELLLLI